jgi:predicted phage tail protein
VTLFLKKEWGFLLIALEFREEKPVVKVRNVGKGEGIFRLITGVILIILAFFISGVFRWILGLIGVVVILTAIFGY